ncbi:MAG: hypothetical protein M0Q92_06130 [Methanoregula sp.]|jgi:hypothetical protein|nr:hypothetical protein [Methanoregula sp.]
MDFSGLQNNYPVINQASRDMMALFGPRFTNRQGGHIETDISAAASVAGLQVLRRLAPAVAVLQPGQMMLYPGRAEELDIIVTFMAGVCEGLELDPKSGWNMKKPDEAHVPLYDIPEMERKVEKDFLDICHRHPLEREYYPFVAILAAMRLVSAGNKMHILDENIGKELALFHLYAGSTTAPHPPQEGS